MGGFWGLRIYKTWRIPGGCLQFYIDSEDIIKMIVVFPYVVDNTIISDEAFAKIKNFITGQPKSIINRLDNEFTCRYKAFVREHITVSTYEKFRLEELIFQAIIRRKQIQIDTAALADLLEA